MSKHQCIKCEKYNNNSNKFCIYCGAIQKQKNNSYDIAMNTVNGLWVALLSKVAKSDGSICKKEAAFMSKVFDSFVVQDKIQNRDIYKQILNSEKENLQNIDKLCNKLMVLGVSKSKKQEIIKSIIALAYEDGEYSQEEENLIIKITHALMLSFLDYKEIEKNFQPKNNEYNKEQSKQNKGINSAYLTIDECYTVLEVSKTCTNVELKKSYRSLVKQYHSDILKGKDLPKDLIAFADEKLKSLNFAYEKLNKYRSN